MDFCEPAAESSGAARPLPSSTAWKPQRQTVRWRKLLRSAQVKTGWPKAMGQVGTQKQVCF